MQQRVDGLYTTKHIYYKQHGKPNNVQHTQLSANYTTVIPEMQMVCNSCMQRCLLANHTAAYLSVTKALKDQPARACHPKNT